MNDAYREAELLPSPPRPKYCYCKPNQCSAPRPEWCVGRRFCERNPNEDNPKGVWLAARDYHPQGSMVLWRMPNDKGGYHLALAYHTKSGQYKICDGFTQGRSLGEMSHFMEIPE